MTTVNDIIESLRKEPERWKIGMVTPLIIRASDELYIHPSCSVFIFGDSKDVHLTGFINTIKLRYAVWKWKKTTQEKK